MSVTNLEYAIARGRAAMAGMYTDRCRISRLAVPGEDEYVAQVLDRATGKYPDPGRVTVYQGPCRMQVKADINSNVVETTAGEREFTYLTSQLQIPVTAAEALLIDAAATGDPADVETDNVVDYLDAKYDTSLIGRQFQLAGPYRKSHAVYRRFRVKEPV